MYTHINVHATKILLLATNLFYGPTPPSHELILRSSSYDEVNYGMPKTQNGDPLLQSLHKYEPRHTK
jgi:hypothetical protein